MKGLLYMNSDNDGKGYEVYKLEFYIINVINHILMLYFRK